MELNYKMMKFYYKRRKLMSKIIYRLSKINIDTQSNSVLQTIAISLAKTIIQIDYHKTLNEIINKRTLGYYEEINNLLYLGKKCQCGNESKIQVCPFDEDVNNCINYCNCCETCSQKCSNNI